MNFIITHFKKIFCVILVCIFLIKGTLNRIPHTDAVHFLDVGQGDSILFQLASSHTILIDGGPGEKVLSGIGAKLPFYVRTIDVIVLTHPHRDHMEGLIEVIRRYNVKHIVLAGDMYESSLYKTFLKTLEIEPGLTVHFADKTTDFTVGTTFFDTLYPIDSFAGKHLSNTNNASVVIRADFKLSSTAPESKSISSMLFTGDCEEECEHDILAHYFSSKKSGSNNPLKSDVLKVGHHGSRTSTTPQFLNKVDPTIAVIQAGKDNQFLHPHPETLQKLDAQQVATYRTDLQGTVTLQPKDL